MKCPDERVLLHNYCEVERNGPWGVDVALCFCTQALALETQLDPDCVEQAEALVTTLLPMENALRVGLLVRDSTVAVKHFGQANLYFAGEGLYGVFLESPQLQWRLL